MIRNTTTVWGWPAKLLHWAGAIVILILVFNGWWMTHLTPRPDRLASYAWHSALGYDVLILMGLRLLWRWVNPVPAQPPDSMPGERLAARLEHIALYVLMFAALLTGWAAANALRVPMSQDLFGLPVPQIVGAVDRTTRKLILESHNALAYVLAVLVAVHIARALRNHFWKKNDVFRRIM